MPMPFKLGQNRAGSLDIKRRTRMFKDGFVPDFEDMVQIPFVGRCLRVGSIKRPVAVTSGELRKFVCVHLYPTEIPLMWKISNSPHLRASYLGMRDQFYFHQCSELLRSAAIQATLVSSL